MTNQVTTVPNTVAARGTRRETEVLTWLLIAGEVVFIAVALMAAVIDYRIGHLLNGGADALDPRVHNLLVTLRIVILISSPFFIASIVVWRTWLNAVRRNVRDAGGQPEAFIEHRALRIAGVAASGYFVVALVSQLILSGQRGTATLEYLFLVLRIVSALLMVGAIVAFLVVRRDIRKLPPPPPRPAKVKGSGPQVRSPGWLSTEDPDVAKDRLVNIDPMK